MNTTKEILLTDIRDPVKKELNHFETELASQFDSELLFLRPVCDYIKSGRGKRIRPLLFFLIQGLFGKPKIKSATIPVLLEILHTATLIHDDVVDNATKRRERDSVNVLWGNKTAILFGDYLFARVLDLGISTRNLKILDIISEVVKKISVGELRQVFKSRKIDKKIYYNIINEKTAALFTASCKLAGISQSASEDDVNQLEQFGKLFGTMYQIKDDILDFNGNAESLGKSVGQDLLDNNYTLPFIMVYNTISDDDKEYLQNLITDINEENLKIIYDFIRENNGVELSEKELESINNQAVSILKNFDDSVYRDSLETLLQYNYLRRK